MAKGTDGEVWSPEVLVQCGFCPLESQWWLIYPSEHQSTHLQNHVILKSVYETWRSGVQCTWAQKSWQYGISICFAAPLRLTWVTVFFLPSLFYIKGFIYFSKGGTHSVSVVHGICTTGELYGLSHPFYLTSPDRRTLVRATVMRREKQKVWGQETSHLSLPLL